jgi:hypothetical protein
MSDELDLDITNYSLDDLLSLFQMPLNFTLQDMKRAKKTVLMTHPDKSGKPKEVFLFFSKAYKLLHNLYTFKNKADGSCSRPTEYSLNDENHNAMLGAFSKQEDFNKRFNELFEKYKDEYQEEDGHGEWLKSENDLVEEVHNRDQMNEAIAERKKTMRALVVKQDIQGIGSEWGTDLIGETSGYFGNGSRSLQYDDLRKAYTESVVPVTEEDRRESYRSVDELIRTRDHTLHEACMTDQETLLREKIEREEIDSTSRAYNLALQDEKMRKGVNAIRSNILRVAYR